MAEKAEAERDQGERHEKRGRQRENHRQRERREEQACQSTGEQQGDEDENRGACTDDVRSRDILQSPGNSGPLSVTCFPPVADALEDDDRVVGDQAEGHGDRAERHQVQAMTGGVETGDADEQRSRDAERQEPRTAAQSENKEHDADGKHAADGQVPLQVRSHGMNQVSLIVDPDEMDMRGQLVDQGGETGRDRSRHRQRGCTLLLEDRDRDAGSAIG